MDPKSRQENLSASILIRKGKSPPPRFLSDHSGTELAHVKMMNLILSKRDPRKRVFKR